MRFTIVVLCSLLLCAKSASLPTEGRFNLGLERSLSSRVPCKRRDIECWCEKAKDYTNDARRKNGVKKMLKLGPKNQLKNANRYAEALSRRGILKHQILPQVTREVGCQRWIGGENLAFNNEDGYIAKACVNQWIKSKPHFENLVRDWFEEVVVGFHFDTIGRVFCVQTFSLQTDRGTIGRPNDRECCPVGQSS